MTRSDAIDKLIDLKEVPKFLAVAKESYDSIAPIFNSEMPDWEKKEAIFQAGVKIGLYSDDEVPN